MHINKINQNTTQFKGLKINKQAEPLLQEKSAAYIKRLNKIGNELKSIDNYDMIFDKNLDISVKKAGENLDIFAGLRKEMKYAGKYYSYENCNGNCGCGFWPNIPSILELLWSDNRISPELFANKYNNFKNSDNISQATELMKLLDHSNKIKNTRDTNKLLENIIKKDSQLIQNMPNNKRIKTILNNYGIEDTPFNKN